MCDCHLTPVDILTRQRGQSGVSVNLNVTNSSFLLKKYDNLFMFVKGEL
jgi:hypothetical protein